MIKKHPKIAFPALFVAAVFFCFWGKALAQPNLPATITVPVTFYDFRSDRSNPEFEQPHSNGRRLGMVANTLDADNKPQIGPSPYRNYGIAHWFRDWSTYSAGPYSRGRNMTPVYTPAPGIRQACGGSGGANCDEWNATVQYVNDANVGHDTAFKNIVIPGELIFTLVPNRNDGMYEFSRRGNNMFFPLNGEGFGNEWVSVSGAPSRNYSFTMELSFEFQARADMEFNFEGDDDVWVFIDNRLVLDIGGVHGPIADQFTVSSVPGVTVGGYHTLRVFYAERHSTDANIWIQTNIVAPPASMDISTRDNTSGNGIITGPVTKPADTTLTLYSVVYDDNNVIMTPGQYDCNHVTWTINGRPAGTGCSIEVADSVAGTLEIRSTYRDPASGDVVEKTIRMTVQGLPPVAVTINTTNRLDSLNLESRRGSDMVYFNPGQEEVTVYAVFRDVYGNAVGVADPRSQSNVSGDWYTQGGAQWGVGNTNVATFGSSHSGTANGSTTVVNIEQEGAGTEDTIFVSITVCGGVLTNCTALRAVTTVGSRSVGAIAAGPNPFVPGVSVISELLGPAVANRYSNVINNSGTGGVGLLLAVDAPRPLQPNSGGTGASGGRQFGRVIIYDAVGNVVKRDVLYSVNEGVQTSYYGFVWDGKNESGRSVGPGTYLVRATGRDVDGKSFLVQRRVGVTKE